ARHAGGELLQDRHEGDVGDHDAILRMVDDPCDLVGEQPRVHGVADRADPHDAVPAFEMAPGVPGDGGDAVAELDAVALQHLRQFQCAPVNFGVIGADYGAFNGSRHNLLRAVILRRVLDDPVTQQRPVLHQTQHKIPPAWYSSAHPFQRVAAGSRIDMNLSAEKRRRKWANGSIWRGWAPMVTVAAGLSM